MFLGTLLKFAESSVKNANSTSKRILDLCCGTGSVLAVFAEAGWRGVGMDFCTELVTTAHQSQLDSNVNSRFEFVDSIEELHDEMEFELIVAFDDLAFELSDTSSLDAVLNLAFQGLSIGGHFLFQIDRSGDYDLSRLLEGVRRSGFHAAWAASPALLDDPWIREHQRSRELVVARRDC